MKCIGIDTYNCSITGQVGMALRNYFSKDNIPCVIQYATAGSSLLFPRDVCGILCARDGFKTDPRTPNGQDATENKLIVKTLHRPCSVRRDSSRRGGLQ